MIKNKVFGNKSKKKSNCCKSVFLHLPLTKKTMRTVRFARANLSQSDKKRTGAKTSKPTSTRTGA